MTDMYAQPQNSDTSAASVVGGDMSATDVVEKALRRAYSLGQRYWQQADSEYISHHRKADITQATYEELVMETLAMLDALRAENARLSEEGARAAENIGVLLAGQDALKAENARLQADARRWRWLRDQHEASDSAETYCVFAPDFAAKCLEPVGSMEGELDAAIDAAIAGERHA